MRNFSFLGLKAVTTGVALTMTAGLAFAGDTNVTTEQILGALAPKHLTRGMSAPVEPTQADAEAKARQTGFLQGLRNRQARSLSTSEREQIAEITTDKPAIDLEINFDFNSASISATSMPSVKALGEALSDPKVKGSTFVVAGHTDGVGGDAFNQGLSERRADTIKQYLVSRYHIAGSDLVTVGYGKTKLKDANDPNGAINRRVQVVNMETKNASK
jgi:outer membrane protein OmpA-like peptidoglycan-associated protein